MSLGWRFETGSFHVGLGDELDMVLTCGLGGHDDAGGGMRLGCWFLTTWSY